MTAASVLATISVAMLARRPTACSGAEGQDDREPGQGRAAGKDIAGPAWLPGNRRQPGEDTSGDG
jgi:hypothetical protein